MIRTAFVSSPFARNRSALRYFAPPSFICSQKAFQKWLARPTSRPYRTAASMKVHASKSEKLVLRAVNRGVDRVVAEMAVSHAERAIREWTCTVSDFLTPAESAALVEVLSSLSDVTVRFWGGYAEAERGVIVAAHAEIAGGTEELLKLVEDELVLLRIEGKFEYERACHRDFMGAILNAGISRRKVGDIIVLDTRGAQVIVSNDVGTFLESTVCSVRKVRVGVKRMDLQDMEMVTRRVKEVQSVENSMRLDAIVSAGLSVSRSKIADMSRSGLVFVNYKEVRTASKNLKAGDVVSVRGVGKLEIGGFSSTAKGRYRVEMKRYI